MNGSTRIALGLALIAASGAPASDAPARVPRDWRLLTRADGLPDEDVTAVRLFEGTLWVGTRRCLARLEQGCWSSWDAAAGLPDAAILSIDVDPATRDVWLGTLGSGLWRFSAGRLDRFDQFDSGLAGNVVFSVRVVGSHIWAATNGGLCAFDWVHDTWDLHLERRARSPETVVRAIEAAPGGVWAAGWEEGVWQVEDADQGAERLAPLAESAPVGLAHAQGVPWVGGAERVWKLQAEGSWKSRAAPTPPGPAACFTVSDTGRIWFGSGSGLWLLADFDSGDWSRIDPGLPRAGVLRCLAAFGDELWAGTSRGLLHGGSVSRAASAPPRPSETLVQSQPAERTSKPAYVALLGPFSRTLALANGESAVASRLPVDPEAADFAVRAHAASRAPEPATPVVVQAELPGLFPYAWGTAEHEIIAACRKHEPLALVGWIDPGERVTCALSLHEELPWINASLSEPGQEELASPWIFRCPGQDPQQQARLLERCLAELGCSRPVLLFDGMPYDDLHLNWWKAAAERRGAPVVAELPLAQVLADPRRLEAQLKGPGFDVVLCWTDARSSGELVRSMRARGLDQPVLASDAAVSPAFLERAGAEPGRVLAARPCRHHEEDSRRTVGDGPGLPPGASTISRATYEATRHLLDAIERGGTRRAELRRILEQAGELELVRLAAGQWH